MEEPSFVRNLLNSIRATSKYYTGYPKDLGPSRVIHFTSEREFVQLLHQGHPIVVAFTIKYLCNLTKHLDKVLEEAAAEFYPFMRASYSSVRWSAQNIQVICITRQKKEYPFIEVFHSPQQTSNQGKVADPNVTKYAVQVLPFNYDTSAYGFIEFFKRHRDGSSDMMWNAA